jgi:hypothetical protein
MEVRSSMSSVTGANQCLSGGFSTKTQGSEVVDAQWLSVVATLVDCTTLTNMRCLRIVSFGVASFSARPPISSAVRVTCMFKF